MHSDNQQFAKRTLHDAVELPAFKPRFIPINNCFELKLSSIDDFWCDNSGFKSTTCFGEL